MKNIYILLLGLVATSLAQNFCIDPSIDIGNTLPGPELVRNGDFENYGVLPWFPSDAEGFTKDGVAGQCGQFSARIDTYYTRAGCPRPNAGLYQQVTLSQTAPKEVIVSAYGLGQNVSGVADVDFSLYVDVTFTDGTNLFGLNAPFPINNGYNRVQLNINEAKPIDYIFVHLLFRTHTGVAYFDNVSVKEAVVIEYPLGENILANPGFEQGNANWTQTGGATCAVTYSGNEYIRTGSGSLSLGAGTADTCFTSVAQTVYFNPPITNNNITFSAYVYISYSLNANTFDFVYIGIATNNDADLSLSERVPYDPTNGFIPVSVTLTANPDTPITEATVSLLVQGKTNGIAYDDASLILS